MRIELRFALLGCLAGITMWAADVTGKWSAQMQLPNGNTRDVTMNLKADGPKLTGTVSGRAGDAPISDGKIDGDNLFFTVVREFNGNQMKMTYKGKMAGDTIHFSVTRDGGEGQSMEMDAKRSIT